MPHIERWVYGWLALATYCFAFDGSHLARQLSIHPFGPFFIAGCLFFLVRFDRLTRARASALLLSLGLSIVSALGGIRGFVHPSDLTASSRVETVLVVVLAFGAFWLIARRRTELPMAARLAFLGALTYPLYLVHNIAKAGLAAYGRNLHPWVQFAVALAFSLALANAMTVNIERRFRKPITRWLTLRYTWCRSGLLGLFEGSA